MVIKMKLLMIDNYDSFTWNLVQYFSELGADVQVIKNDELDIAALSALYCRLVLVRRMKRVCRFRLFKSLPVNYRFWAFA